MPFEIPFTVKKTHQEEAPASRPDIPTTPPFSVGECVYLNSGSPRLTVVEVIWEEWQFLVRCFWVRENGESSEMTVPAVCLLAAPR